MSLATVKTHIIDIYSKLQVSNRVQAVEKYKRIKARKY
nr:LuxR C-terminal-related transcriptional regulator [Clostridium botulinum]